MATGSFKTVGRSARDKQRLNRASQKRKALMRSEMSVHGYLRLW